LADVAAVGVSGKLKAVHIAFEGRAAADAGPIDTDEAALARRFGAARCLWAALGVAGFAEPGPELAVIGAVSRASGRRVASIAPTGQAPRVGVAAFEAVAAVGVFAADLVLKITAEIDHTQPARLAVVATDHARFGVAAAVEGDAAGLWCAEFVPCAVGLPCAKLVREIVTKTRRWVDAFTQLTAVGIPLSAKLAREITVGFGAGRCDAPTATISVECGLAGRAEESLFATGFGVDLEVAHIGRQRIRAAVGAEGTGGLYTGLLCGAVGVAFAGGVVGRGGTHARRAPFGRCALRVTFAEAAVGHTAAIDALRAALWGGARAVEIP